jgi:hypothetical protein
MEIVIGLGGLLLAAVAFVAWGNAQRRVRLIAKYRDAEAVEMIMQKRIWEGMTVPQLLDAWGKPAAIDEKVLKTKTTQVYKYNRFGKNRFHDRVKVDDGVVVGWEQKAQD